MGDEIVKIKSVFEICEFLKVDKPTHPLITVVDTSKVAYDENQVGIKMNANLYTIAMKDKSCGLDYGRNHYDFNEGALIFLGPGQVFSVHNTQQFNEVKGWVLYFHPDLIRNTPLGTRIDDYTFFSYDIHEALHLSEDEEEIITNCIELIQNEISERIDHHSQQVLVSNVELLLNYCSRYYDRQFSTRTTHHRDIVTKVEAILKDYTNTGLLVDVGPPSVQYLAEQCHLSSNYLSDLLKRETGRSAKDHINDFIVDKAKNLLLGSEDTVSGIAYQLGFNYPHYFSRLFKAKTGLTPQEYRHEKLK